VSTFFSRPQDLRWGELCRVSGSRTLAVVRLHTAAALAPWLAWAYTGRRAPPYRRCTRSLACMGVATRYTGWAAAYPVYFSQREVSSPYWSIGQKGIGALLQNSLLRAPAGRRLATFAPPIGDPHPTVSGVSRP
jgi:hypothetical protein